MNPYLKQLRYGNEDPEFGFVASAAEEKIFDVQAAVGEKWNKYKGGLKRFVITVGAIAIVGGVVTTVMRRKSASANQENDDSESNEMKLFEVQEQEFIPQESDEKLILYDDGPYALEDSGEIVWAGEWNDLPIKLPKKAKIVVEKQGEYSLPSGTLEDMTEITSLPEEPGPFAGGINMDHMLFGSGGAPKRQKKLKSRVGRTSGKIGPSASSSSDPMERYFLGSGNEHKTPWYELNGDPKGLGQKKEDSQSKFKEPFGSKMNMPTESQIMDTVSDEQVTKQDGNGFLDQAEPLF